MAPSPRHFFYQLFANHIHLRNPFKIDPDVKSSEITFYEDVPRWLGTLDLLYHPTHAESFGLALLEAMAQGVPVVAAAGGGVPEIVIEGIGTLVPPGDVSAAACAIEDLLRNPSRAKAMAVLAAAHVRHTFSVDREIEGLLRVYEHAMRRAREKPRRHAGPLVVRGS